MGNSAKRDSRQAELAERRRKALELRKSGATYDQIANALHYTDRSNAAKDVKRAILEIIEEPAKDVLSLELARLDALLLGVWQKAKTGDVAALDRAIKIMDRRSAYLGLDAPQVVEQKTTHDVSATPAEAKRIMGELFAGVVGPSSEEPSGDT